VEEAALSGACLLQTNLLGVLDKRFPQFAPVLWEIANTLPFLAK
jgi:hypothetical protein